MGNAAHERHTFHILQRLLEAKNVSLIEDDCPIRTLLRKTLYGATFGSIMHKSDDTRIYMHIRAYSSVFAQDGQNEARSGSRPNRPKGRAPPVHPGAAWQ